MTDYELLLDTGEIDFAPKNEAAEVIQNVKTICTTLKGSVPMRRDFGISGKYIDAVTPGVRALLTSEIYRAVREYEPRAEITGIEYRENEAGELKPCIRIKLA